MGLSFSHCQTDWHYSEFSAFRECLASEIGIKLKDMEGFTKNGKGIPWSTVKDDIRVLLEHSDCDGYLSVDDSAIIAPRLRELISDWSEDYPVKKKAKDLADGMEAASLLGEQFEFI